MRQAWYQLDQNMVLDLDLKCGIRSRSEGPTQTSICYQIGNIGVCTIADWRMVEQLTREVLEMQERHKKK